jgi:hypothetical protein
METEKNRVGFTRRQLLTLASAVLVSKALPTWAADFDGIAAQPYFAGVNRALEALAKLGAPIAAADAAQITALSQRGDVMSVEAAEKILDHYTLARLSVDADGSGHVALGGAQRTLIEQGWRMFLEQTTSTLLLSHRGPVA